MALQGTEQPLLDGVSRSERVASMLSERTASSLAATVHRSGEAATGASASRFSAKTVLIVVGALLGAVAVGSLIGFPIDAAEKCKFSSPLNSNDCLDHSAVGPAASSTMTETASQWPTSSGTASQGATLSMTASQLATPSVTASQGATPSVTASQSVSASQSPSNTQSQDPTSTQTPSFSQSATSSQSASNTNSPSFTPTPSNTPSQSASRVTQMVLHNCVLALQVACQSISDCVNGAVWGGTMGGDASGLHLEINAGVSNAYFNSPFGPDADAVDLPVTADDAAMKANVESVLICAATKAIPIAFSGQGAHVSIDGTIPFVAAGQLDLKTGIGTYLDMANNSTATFAAQHLALAEHGNLRGAGDEPPALDQTS